MTSQQVFLLVLGAVLMLAFQRLIPARVPYARALALLLVLLVIFVLWAARDPLGEYIGILRDE